MKNPTILTFSDKCPGSNNEDGYSLHQEFSKQCTKTDLQCVKQLVTHVNEKENPFDGRGILIKNLVTGATFNGKVANDKFRKERLEVRSTKLFDTIPKSRLSFKKGKP